LNWFTKKTEIASLEGFLAVLKPELEGLVRLAGGGERKEVLAQETM
jgi:hypothetical protein